MYSTMVFILGMVPCLPVFSCSFSMPSTTYTHIFEMTLSMVVSSLTVLLLIHKVLLMETSFLLN